MKSWLKIILLTIVSGFIAMWAANAIWPAHTSQVSPTPVQLGLLIGVGVVEAIAFGLGLSFLVFGWNIVKKIAAIHNTLAVAMFLSIVWSLISWLPHDRLHMHYGENYAALVGIEYGFHLTLIVAAAIIAYGFVKLISAPPAIAAEKTIGTATQAV